MLAARSSQSTAEIVDWGAGGGSIQRKGEQQLPIKHDHVNTGKGHFGKGCVERYKQGLDLRRFCGCMCLEVSLICLRKLPKLSSTETAALREKERKGTPDGKEKAPPLLPGLRSISDHGYPLHFSWTLQFTLLFKP